MNEQNASYLMKHSDLGAKSLKNCSKGTKIASTACKFSKIFWGSMLPNPQEPFSFLICFKITLSEKLHLEICQNLVPLPELAAEQLT